MGEIKEFRVVIFAGHDKDNTYKISPDGYKEHTFNHNVCLKLLTYLKLQGFHVEYPNRNKNPMSLTKRCQIANQGNFHVAVFIHFNAMSYTWSLIRGLETFHYPNANAGGKELAYFVHKELVKGTIMPNRGVKSAKFHVLKYTKMASILVECGFMDNKEDRILMESEPYIEECAEEITEGICNYFGTKFIRPKKVRKDHILILQEMSDWSEVFLAEIENSPNKEAWKAIIPKIYYHGY